MVRDRFVFLRVVFLCCAVGPVLRVDAALLNSYLPASMQALAYYIDHLQYEPLATTTVEPPFSASVDDLQNSTVPTPTQASGTSTTPKSTARPSASATTSWWKPPSWWEDSKTTTARPTTAPTPAHKPAIYAPAESPHTEPLPAKLEGYELFHGLDHNAEGVDPLTLALVRDILTETEHDAFTNDVESLDNFLRLYDDNYGRAAFDPEAAMDRWSSTSTAGKKRVPPTKPYVEFLLVYDLLKRDAKSANLSKYEGYSEELLLELYELSHGSAERQLFTLFKRMLDRGDIQRSDVVSRIQGILKDLGNPDSATSKALRYIPAMPFLP